MTLLAVGAVSLGGGFASSAAAQTPASPGLDASPVPLPDSAAPVASPPAVVLQVGTLPGKLPTPLSREAAVAGTDGATITILGGISASGDTTADMLSLDTSSGAATPMGTLRKPVHDTAAATLGSKTLVVGGGNAVPEATVQSVDATGAATISGHLPAPRADLAVVSVGDKLIVVGGGTDAGPDPAILATTDGAAFTKVGQLAVPVRYPAVATPGRARLRHRRRGCEWGPSGDPAARSGDRQGRGHRQAAAPALRRRRAGRRRAAAGARRAPRRQGVQRHPRGRPGHR